MRRSRTRFAMVLVFAMVLFVVPAALEETGFAALREHEKISGPTPPVPPKKPSLQEQENQKAESSLGEGAGNFSLEAPEFRLPVEKQTPAKDDIKSNSGQSKMKNAVRSQTPEPQKNGSAAEAVPPAPVRDAAATAEPEAAAIEGSDTTKPEPQELHPKIPAGESLSLPIFFYFILFGILGGAVYYIYRRLKEPADLETAKPSPPSFTIVKTKPQAAAAVGFRPPSAAELGLRAKLKNKSLLEQLVKYDMETYGEIRSDLSYDDPYWVEHLIRKYGGGDKSKVNRAILSYHAKRNRK